MFSIFKNPQVRLLVIAGIVIVVGGGVAMMLNIVYSANLLSTTPREQKYAVVNAEIQRMIVIAAIECGFMVCVPASIMLKALRDSKKNPPG